MALTKEAAKALALIAREAADASDVSSNDLRGWLSGALRDARGDDGGYGWCYLTDFIGDGESGNVIFCCDGDLTQAPYTITQTDGSISVDIDMTQCVDIVQMTTYKREGMESVAAEAAKPANKNAKMAAKFKKFVKKVAKKPATPVTEAGARHSKTDQALIQTIHDHSIALGADTATASSDGVDESASLDIIGDVIPLREGAVGQDGTAYLKLIQPGWGSCGFYPAEVIERDGPKIFKTGTKNFWNHQTSAEEAARPEGDLRDLASVLTEDAHYEANGPAGAGLYAKANVFEQFRAPVDSLAKHIGMSIRASGVAKEGKAPDGKSGKIIEKLTHGLSVDYVTTPGAGGQILQLFEAARGRVAPIQTPVAESAQEIEMDAAALQKLQESVTALAADNRKFRERQAITDASGAVAEYFRTVQVSEAIKSRVAGRVLAGTIPMTEAGDLDAKKVKEFAEAQLVDELAFLARLNPQMVVGMGPAATGPAAVAATEAQVAEATKRRERFMTESAGRLGFKSEMGQRILNEGRAAFDPSYNARHLGARAQTGGTLPMEGAQ